MKRVLIACAVVAAVARPVAMAWAAEDTPFAEPAAKLESILGKDVKTLPEGDGGRVIDLLVDNRGQVRAAVVEFGGFLGIGTRKIAVDWSAFRFAWPSVMVDVSRDQLRATPEYKEKETPFVVKPVKD
jgi:PRC-barrel domain